MLKIDGSRSMEEYMDVLSSSLELYVDNERLKDAYHNSCYDCEDFKWLTLLALRIESGGLYYSVDNDSIIHYLESIGIDMSRHANKKTGAISLAIKTVVTPMIERGIAVDVLTPYRDYRSAKSHSSFLSGLYRGGKIAGYTMDGRMICKYDTHIEQQENLRAYYSNIALVSIPKKYSNIVTVPSGEHFIAWCDYPQADWRFAYNLFIRDPNNYHVMSQCKDAYEGLARLVEGDAFDPELFKEQRKQFKVHALSTFYNSMNSEEIPTKIREFFHKCPRYEKLFYDLGILWRFGMSIPCTSYFGYEQMLPETYQQREFVSKGLNTPIQTFTSHVVNETVLGVLEKFYALGYTKDDINIYYVRHDEPLFMCKRTILQDAWIFKECSEIYIPGFTPIHLDFHFGRYYQEEDERLTTEISESIARSEKNGQQYTIYRDEDFASEIKNDYSPMPSVESCYVQFVRNSDNTTTVWAYNYRNGKVKGFTFVDQEGDGPDEELHTALNKEGMLEWLGFPAYLLVRCSGLEFMDYVGPDDSTIMKVINKYDATAVAGIGVTV